MGSYGPDADPRFISHVKREFTDFDELVAAGETVQQLLAHPGWAHLCRLLDAEVDRIDRELDGGSTPLIRAEYAMAHGRRGGIRAVTGAARSVIEEATRQYEEQRAKHERDAESSPVGG